MPSGAINMPDDVLLDTAVLYRDVSATQTKWGASRGGLRFNPGRTLRSVEYDGRRSKQVDLDRVTEYAPVITGTMMEMGANMIDAVEPGNTPAYSAPTRTYTPKDASTMLSDSSGEYLDNVRLTYQRGNGGTWSVLFAKALVTEWEVSGQDNNEGEVQVTIEARRTSAQTDDDPPYVIEITGPDINS